MGVAVFDWSVWSVLYPRLVAPLPGGGGVTEAYATALFNGPAGLLLNNTDSSPVCDVATRTSLLYMVVAHLAALEGPGSSGIVGRIDSATEGSVSVHTDYGQVSAQMAYWIQTPYGAHYWQATARYRTAHYIPPPPSQVDLTTGLYLGVGGFPYPRQPGQW